jgi:hypothetical protein
MRLATSPGSGYVFVVFPALMPRQPPLRSGKAICSGD